MNTWMRGGQREVTFKKRKSTWQPRTKLGLKKLLIFTPQGWKQRKKRKEKCLASQSMVKSVLLGSLKLVRMLRGIHQGPIASNKYNRDRKVYSFTSDESPNMANLEAQPCMKSRHFLEMHRDGTNSNPQWPLISLKINRWSYWEQRALVSPVRVPKGKEEKHWVSYEAASHSSYV